MELEEPELYVDWDLCAVPFSFPGKNTFSPEELDAIFEASFIEKDLAIIEPKIIDKMNQLQEFINKFGPKITILTMNCEDNVLAIINRYNITNINNIVSILDLRASRVGVATNLFSAVLEYRKKKKTVEYIAKKFNVTIEDIVRESSNLNINENYTKAVWAQEQGKPFIFFDDSPSNIDQMNEMIKETTMNASCVLIPRPNYPDKWSVDEMGMFSEAAKNIWPTDVVSSGEQKCKDIPIFKTFSF